MRALILDMDGVLVDSEPQHIQTDIETLGEYGVRLSPQDLRGFTGIDGPTFFQQMRMDHNLSIAVEKLLERKRALLRAELLRHTPAVEGLSEMVEQLSELTELRALATSSEREIMELVLAQLNLSEWFTATVSGDEVTVSKPQPEIFLKAAERLAVRPEDCLVLEDSTHGVMAARAAGMTVVGYANPQSGNQDLHRADKCISSLLEFPKIVSRYFTVGVEHPTI